MIILFDGKAVEIVEIVKNIHLGKHFNHRRHNIEISVLLFMYISHSFKYEKLFQI